MSKDKEKKKYSIEDLVGIGKSKEVTNTVEITIISFL